MLSYKSGKEFYFHNEVECIFMVLNITSMVESCSIIFNQGST